MQALSLRVLFLGHKDYPLSFVYFDSLLIHHKGILTYQVSNTSLPGSGLFYFSRQQLIRIVARNFTPDMDLNFLRPDLSRQPSRFFSCRGKDEYRPYK